MALNAYLRLKGVRQGVIQGSSIQKGQEGKIVVLAADHQVLIPSDLASGLATGKRQHKPFTITKQLDQATPLLYQALSTNEVLVEWELQLWQPDERGETLYYTVKLANAAIREIHFTMPNLRDADLQYAPYEEVSFTYQKIEWSWMEGGVVGRDDWGGFRG